MKHLHSAVWHRRMNQGSRTSNRVVSSDLQLKTHFLGDSAKVHHGCLSCVRGVEGSHVVANCSNTGNASHHRLAPANMAVQGQSLIWSGGGPSLSDHALRSYSSQTTNAISSKDPHKCHTNMLIYMYTWPLLHQMGYRYKRPVAHLTFHSVTLHSEPPLPPPHTCSVRTWYTRQC